MLRFLLPRHIEAAVSNEDVAKRVLLNAVYLELHWKRFQVSNNATRCVDVANSWFGKSSGQD